MPIPIFPATLHPGAGRSEEHTSELQSHLNLVCRLLLEKKNNISVTDTHLARKSEPDLCASNYISELSDSTACVRKRQISSRGWMRLSHCVWQPRVCLYS